MKGVEKTEILNKRQNSDSSQSFVEKLGHKGVPI